MEWATGAIPKDVEGIGCTPSHPEVAQAAFERGITSIVHFTRTTGLKGILHSSALKARRYLPEDYQVRHVYRPNAPDRSRDWGWHGYANLSVTDINRELFGRSRRWHPEAEWVIIRFDPIILGDPGVVFCTTNNAYQTVQRGEGYPALIRCLPLRCRGAIWGRFPLGGIEHLTRQPTRKQKFCTLVELSLEHLQAVCCGR